MLKLLGGTQVPSFTAAGIEAPTRPEVGNKSLDLEIAIEARSLAPRELNAAVASITNMFMAKVLQGQACLHIEVEYASTEADSSEAIAA